MKHYMESVFQKDKVQCACWEKMQTHAIREEPFSMQAERSCHLDLVMRFFLLKNIRTKVPE